MLVTLGDRHHLDGLGGDWEFGDHPVELVDDPTQLVSGCGRFTEPKWQRFPKPKDPTNLVGDEIHYEKWNTKAKNTLFRGLCKDVFNHVWNHRLPCSMVRHLYAP